MLTLNEEQWRALQTHDARQFVAAVCDQFLASRPDMLERPGREPVLGRMQAAHDYAARTGFTSTPHIVHLMYMAADAPHFHDDPQTDAYLRKPGATPEQRYDDLMAVINAKLKEAH
jgi:hypothetical protein